MLRSILRQKWPAPAPAPAPERGLSSLMAAYYSSSTDQKQKAKRQSKTAKRTEAAGAGDDASAASDADADYGERARRLEFDDKDPSLDVGPNARPLFTSTPSLSRLANKDCYSYFKFSSDELSNTLPEGLPEGLAKEFKESLRSAVLVRQSFLDLRDNFRRVVDPTLSFPKSKDLKVRKQVVLDGKVSCGKSTTLAMLVHWARQEGWLVLYVPNGRQWTQGSFFYKNEETGLWDTPAQADTILKDFLKFNETRLKELPCQMSDPIPLGEGSGVGKMKDGSESISLPESPTLYDIADTGIKNSQASVGALVRLRKELSLVKDVPVLIAIDQYNSWFTFSDYKEAVTVRSTRQLHARELATVNAFRSMKHNVMMVGAFSHSTAVGKLRSQLPDVPDDARLILPRYSLDEAATVSYYYLRQRLVTRDEFSDEGWKKMYYLSGGNGAEMRWLMPFMQWRLEDTPYADSPYASKKSTIS